MGAALKTPARHIGKYEVREHLGSGGMSDVYAAVHTGLRRRVALKVLRTALRDDADAVERFLREGECAARVSHPNVVSVHDVGVESGVPYLVMELLEGETLEERIMRDGALFYREAVDLLLPVFDAVDHVHRAGVIHRDIKPSNILLARYADGSMIPKLMDFGVATLKERRLITASLGPIGTPTYMSPEQARGLDPVDARSDQYSLASVLFEMLTGTEPFPGADVESVIDHVVRGRFPRLSDRMRDIPAGLDEALRRATAYDPRDRFRSAREFGDAITPFASRRAIEARNERSASRLAAPRPRSERSRGRAGRESQVTLRVRPSHERIVSPSARRKRTMIWSVAALAMGLGVFVGMTGAARTDDVATTALDVHAHTVFDQHPAEPSRAAASTSTGEQTGADMQRPLSSAPTGHALMVTPSHAEVFLDQRRLGRGRVVLPEAGDDSLHELRIVAKGHVPRVMLFRKQPAISEITLKPTR